MQFLLKVLISATLIATVSELAKRSVLMATILISLPVSSLIAMSFLYHDTGDAGRVADFCGGIFWALLPTLLFFLLFPYLVRSGWKFGPALAGSCTAMVLGYWVYSMLLEKFGVRL